MFDAIVNPFLTVAELPSVEAVLRVLAVLLGMARQSKHDRELIDCNQRLNDYQEKLRQSEEQRKKFEAQRDALILIGLVVIAIVVLASIEYRVVPRSLPA